MTADEQHQVEELWHNLFRLESYVTDPRYQERARHLLRASWWRLRRILPPEALRRLEPPEGPPGQKEVSA